MNDNVNHPSHYTQGPVHDRCGEVVECITVTEGMNFNVGNAVKYLWRCDAKDNGQNAIQDLEKARWYITREIERRQYEAARNEPPLFEDDDVKPAIDFTWKDLLNSTPVPQADEPGPATLDDTNSHVCVNGQRVPGTECGFRRLFGDITRRAGN